MYYLEVAHSEDNDSDYFKFTTIYRALEYIILNGLSEFKLTDRFELPVTEYTLVS